MISPLVLTASLFIIFLVTTPISFAQSTDSLFKAALDFEKKNKNDEAISIYSQLLTDNLNVDMYRFALGRSLYHAERYAEAQHHFEQFLALFPDSRYRKEACFFLGGIHCYLEQPTEAAQQYLQAYGLATGEKTPDTKFTALVDSSLAVLFRNVSGVYLEEADLSSLTKDTRCPLLTRLANVRSMRGDTEGALRLTALCEPAAPVIAKPVDTANAVKIAVVLPFSGENAEFAEQIFNGAKIASMTEKCSRAIQLVPYDTEGDKIIGAGLLNTIAKDNTFIAAIGPLTSDESAVAAAALNGSNLPIIVPAASDVGFTELSSSVFQLTPNIAVQAERMASYAIEQLHADTVVILTSDDAEHRRMAESFTNRFTQSGGTVAVQIFYVSGEKDFKSIIGDIKYSLRSKESDSLSFINDAGDTLDIAERPIRVDCIYMPGKPEQIRLLLPQLRFYNVNSTYLGSDEWGDQAVYGLGTSVLKNAIFPSAYILPQETEEEVRFASKYLYEYQTAPGRLARVGYDALSCICASFGAAKPTRDALAAQLLTTNRYSGLSGGVIFTQMRVNTRLPLYRVQGGQPVLVEEKPVVTETSSDQEQ